MADALAFALIVALIVALILVAIAPIYALYCRVQAVRNRLPGLTRRKAISLRPAFLTDRGRRYRKEYLRALTVGLLALLLSAFLVFRLFPWFLFVP